MEDNSYYVGLATPAEIKKDLLEASKEVLLCLKSYEYLQNSIAELESEKILAENGISEILSLIKKVKQDLPMTGQPPRFENVQDQKPVEKKKTKVIGQLEKIEKELDLIEEKIGDLS